MENSKLTAATKKRTILADLLRSLEPYDGRYLWRIDVGDLDRLRAAIALADGHVLIQDVTPATYGRKKINLAGLRDSLATAEALVHDLDALDTLPELDVYLKSLESLKTASLALRAAVSGAGIASPPHWLYPVASF